MRQAQIPSWFETDRRNRRPAGGGAEAQCLASVVPFPKLAQESVPRSDGPEARRRWLCIAYAFPPIHRSGTHRTLGFVRHLADLGWNATVLTVVPDGEPLDDSLSALIPDATRVLRTPWVRWMERIKGFIPSPRPRMQHGDLVWRTPSSESCPAPATRCWRPSRVLDWLTRLCITPDSRTGWILPAVRRAWQAIRRQRPHIIYSTSPYMSAHLIALVLSRLAQIPWVADFRDPWRGNPYRSLPSPSLDRFDAWLERLVVRHATHVVFNTPTAAAQACARMPKLVQKSSTILNGYDADAYTQIRLRRLFAAGDDPLRRPEQSEEAPFVFAHAGEFYGPRRPHTLFAALRLAASLSQKKKRSLVVCLIGPRTYDGQELHGIAQRYGVEKWVRILGRKDHTDTLGYLAGSDAVLLVGSSGPGGELQIPNKFFEYLALRRPILAAMPAANPVVALLKEAQAEFAVCDPDDEQGYCKALLELAQRRGVKTSAPWSGVENFDRRKRALELADVFVRVAPN